MSDETRHHARIREQYSPESGAVFYRRVMGDGMPVIHYGLYPSTETPMGVATLLATERLMEIATHASTGGPWRRILDLGAGPGGSAHLLATRTEADVTCVDLCEHHQIENQETAVRLGLDGRIHTWCGSFECLPDEWSGRFDLVWSQEAICHASDPESVFKGAFRVLRPGGVMVFSDILLGDEADESQAAAFRKVNAVTTCRTVSEVSGWLTHLGFVALHFEDWSSHLPENFRKMRRQIDLFRKEMCAAGVAGDFLDRFSTSLDQRLAWRPGAVLRWGAFTASKPDVPITQKETRPGCGN